MLSRWLSSEACCTRTCSVSLLLLSAGTHWLRGHGWFSGSRHAWSRAPGWHCKYVWGTDPQDVLLPTVAFSHAFSQFLPAGEQEAEDHGDSGGGDGRHMAAPAVGCVVPAERLDDHELVSGVLTGMDPVRMPDDSPNASDACCVMGRQPVCVRPCSINAQLGVGSCCAS